MAGFSGLGGGVAVSVLRDDRVVARPPAGEAPGLRRQIVEGCGQRCEPAAKPCRVDQVVVRGRTAGYDGNGTVKPGTEMRGTPLERFTF